METVGAALPVTWFITASRSRARRSAEIGWSACGGWEGGVNHQEEKGARHNNRRQPWRNDGEMQARAQETRRPEEAEAARAS